MANNNTNGRRWAMIVTYRECHRNHSRLRGHHILDGCIEFMAGEDSTPEAFICATCHCPRTFHRREEAWVAVDPGIYHQLYHTTAAPAQPLVPVLAAHIPQDVFPVPPPPPPEENLGDGVEAEVAQQKRRERVDMTRSEAI